MPPPLPPPPAAATAAGAGTPGATAASVGPSDAADPGLERSDLAMICAIWVRMVGGSFMRHVLHPTPPVDSESR